MTNYQSFLPSTLTNYSSKYLKLFWLIDRLFYFLNSYCQSWRWRIYRDVFIQLFCLLIILVNALNSCSDIDWINFIKRICKSLLHILPFSFHIIWILFNLSASCIESKSSKKFLSDNFWPFNKAFADCYKVIGPMTFVSLELYVSIVFIHSVSNIWSADGLRNVYYWSPSLRKLIC